MPTLKEIFDEMGLGRVVQGMAAIAQPSVRLAGVDYGEAAGMRMGGRPNLPPDVDWPVADLPLPFFAQIDLAEIPAIPGIELPRSGGLYFFYEGEGAVWEWEQRRIF